jgi:hypothetical protein
MPQASGWPSQVAVPFAGAGQGVHAVFACVPHDMMLLFCAHIIPQRW